MSHHHHHGDGDEPRADDTRPDRADHVVFGLLAAALVMVAGTRTRRS